MATRNQRDVTLDLEIRTAGEDNLRKLAKEVRSLADAGTDAAPDLTRLADEFDRLAAQAKALEVFRQAAQGIDEATAASRRATAESERLKQQYDEQRLAAESLRAAEAKIREELDAAQRAVAEQRKEQALLTAAKKAGTVAAEEYGKASADVASKLAVFRQQADNLKIDLRNAEQQTAEAEQALAKLGTASLRAAQNADQLDTAVRQQAAAIERAKAAGAELGASFDDAAAAQERLDAALREASGALTATVQTQKLRAEQQATQAAIQKLTDDIDAQADAVRGKLVTSLQAASDEYEKEQAQLRQSINLAEQRAAAQREQAESDRLAATQAAALAAAREAGQAAAQAELAALADSAAFSVRYAAAQAEAARAALDTAGAQRIVAEAASRATSTIKELEAATRATGGAAGGSLDPIAAALADVEAEAAKAALGVQRLQGYFDKLKSEQNVLEGAFGATGVRSIQAIEQEMFKVQRALVTLRAEFAAGSISVADFDRATSAARVKLESLRREIDTVPGDRSVFDQLADGADNLVTKYGRLTAALATVGFAVQPVIQAFIQLEATTRILTQVTGSSAEAARQIEFLRDTARQSGQSFDDLSQSYAKFAASALQAGVSTEQTQAAFKAVALAAGNLGLSSDQAKRALEALSQMASKGVVSMEELRQQLGDALPGVLPLLAQQLGLTGQELNKLVESGGLLAQDAIPAITAALGRLADGTKDVDGLAASWNRFKNVVMEAGTTLMEGPLGKGAGALLTAFAGVTRDLTVAAVGASEALNVVGRTVGLIAAAVTGNIASFREFREEFDKILLESGDKVGKFRDRAYAAGEATKDLAGQAKAATPALEQQAAALGQTATAATTAATGQTAMAGAAQQAGQAAAAAAPQHQAAAAAITQVAAAAGGTTSRLAKLTVDYEANVSAAKELAQNLDKTVEARKAEAEAMRTSATLSGDDAQQKRAAAEAAQLVAGAERDLADAKTNVVGVLKAQRAAIEAQAAAEGRLDAARKKQLADLDDRIAKEEAVAEAARQSASAAQVQALAARTAADAVKDNSDRIGELGAAYVSARQRVDEMRAAHQQGLVTQASVNLAVAQAAAAQRLYSDALADSVRRSKDAIEARRALAAIETEGLRVAQAESRSRQQAAEALKDYAQRKGDVIDVARAERTVAEEGIKQKQLEADLLKTEARLIVDTVNARLASISQQRSELESLGQLTPEKRRELEIEELQQKALLKTADARLAAVKGIDAQVAAMKRMRQESLLQPGGYDLGVTGGFGGFGSQAAMNARNEAITSSVTSGTDNLLRERPITSGFGKPGSADPNGRITGTYQTGQLQPPTNDGMWEFSPNDWQWKRTPAGRAKDAAEAAARAAANNAVIGTAFKNAGIDERSLYGAAGRPLFGSRLPQPVRDQLQWDRGVVTARPQPAAAAETSRYVFELRLPSGGTTQVNVASEQDAVSMRDFFERLQSDLARSGGGLP